jgi:AmiR/NasT family two-component response regulator
MPEIETTAKLGDALVMAMRQVEREREVDVLRTKLRTARQENLQLEKRLAERKLVERAKGLLQVNFGWSEEDAYYHLRRTSRQERIPMAVIAQRVIDVAAAREVEEMQMSA